MKRLSFLVTVLVIGFIAVSGCSKTKEEKRANELIKKMKSGYTEDYTAAVKELVEMGSPAVKTLIKELKNGDERVRCGAAEALGKIEDARAIKPLIKALKDKGRYNIHYGGPYPYTVRVNSCAAKALAKIGDKSAVEPLIKLLKDGDSDDRCSAAEALGAMGDERAIEPLIEALRSRSATIRQVMAQALTDITGKYLDFEYDVWKQWYEANREDFSI